MKIRLKDPVAKAMHLSVALLQEELMHSQSRAGQVGIQGDSKADGLFGTLPGKGEDVKCMRMHPGWAVQIALPLKRPAMVLVLEIASPFLCCCGLAKLSAVHSHDYSESSM